MNINKHSERASERTQRSFLSSLALFDMKHFTLYWNSIKVMFEFIKLYEPFITCNVTWTGAELDGAQE